MSFILFTPEGLDINQDWHCYIWSIHNSLTSFRLNVGGVQKHFLEIYSHVCGNKAEPFWQNCVFLMRLLLAVIWWQHRLFLASVISEHLQLILWWPKQTFLNESRDVFQPGLWQQSWIILLSAWDISSLVNVDNTGYFLKDFGTYRSCLWWQNLMFSSCVRGNNSRYFHWDIGTFSSWVCGD